MRIAGMSVQQIWKLTKASFTAWINDYAPSMGAALAYYTIFSLAPLLIIVIAVAGLVFGADVARGEIVAQLRALIGDAGAQGVETLLQSASRPSQGIIASVVGAFTLILGATSVFGELQSALDRIWRAPAAVKSSGLWDLVRTRLLSFGMVLSIGFLLLSSLVVSTALAAVGKWWGALFPGWEVLMQLLNIIVSLGVITVLFALIYRMPAARPRCLARCVDWGKRHLAALHGWQVCDRHVPGQGRRDVRVRRRGVDCPVAGLGVLLDPDLPARCRIHLAVCARARFPRRAGSGIGDGGGAKE